MAECFQALISIQDICKNGSDKQRQEHKKSMAAAKTMKGTLTGKLRNLEKSVEDTIQLATYKIKEKVDHVIVLTELEMIY